MNFLVSLQSELHKLRRTSVLYIAILAAFLIAFLIAVDFYNTPSNSTLATDYDPWLNYIRGGFRITSILIMPLIIVIVCTLLPQIEYRNNTWKQVLASPQSKLTIFLAKYFSAISMILWFMLCLNVFTVVMGFLLDHLRETNQFRKHELPIVELMKLNARTVVSGLAVTALQFWAGLRFRNFITPIAIGFLLWFSAGAISFEFHLPGADWHPYSYGMFVAFEKYQHLWSSLMWRSTGFCAVFLAFGFMDFNTKRIVN